MADNRMDFTCEVDDLFYLTVEEKLSKYFCLGQINKSTLPEALNPDHHGIYIIAGHKASGTFYISTRLLTNGDFLLDVECHTLRVKDENA